MAKGSDEVTISRATLLAQLREERAHRVEVVALIRAQTKAIIAIASRIRPPWYSRLWSALRRKAKT